MGSLFRHPFAREIAAILIVKLLVILAIAYAFFGPDTKPKQDPDSVAKAVLERPAAPPPLAR
jgi:hypothetical protein